MNIEVIDNWAPDTLVRSAWMMWPPDDWPYWHRYGNGKLASKDFDRCPSPCQELLRRMLAIDVGHTLGVYGVFGDWTLYGGGMHSMPIGSSLGMHLDSDHHPVTGWSRCANAVLTIGDACDGGEFVIDNGFDRRTVRPNRNQLVLFEPGDDTWHGVTPITSGRRLTLAVFFWSAKTRLKRRPSAEFRDGEGWKDA